MTIKHISFDVWNTLITANPEYTSARSAAIATIAGITKEQAAEAYTTVKKKLDTEAEELRCGDVNHAWNTLGLHLGVSEEKTRRMQMVCEHLFHVFPPHMEEDLIGHLMVLGWNYEVSIKSNTNFISGRILSSVMGFDRMPWFSFTHFSDHWRMCKPDALFFAQTLLCSSDQELIAEEVLHIGDSKTFDGGCVDIGFNFCHIKNPQDLLEKLNKGEIINA